MAFISHSDYYNASAVMSSATALRDYIFHRTLPKPTTKRMEQTTLLIHTKQKSYIMDEESIEKENVQLCIQNEEKLIAFLMNVRSRHTITAVIFTSASNIMIIIKSHNMHPVLIMKYPLDDIRIYSRAAGLVFELPLEELIVKSTQNFSTADGYALYYSKTVDKETKQTHISLCYKLPSGEISKINSVPDVNVEYINRLLQPSLLLDKQIVMATRPEDKISHLNEISLMMLINIQSITTFKDMGKEQSVTFAVAPDDKGVLQMNMLSGATVNNSLTIPIANESNSMVWQFKSSINYQMYERTAVLLQSTNSKIKLGSDFLYFAFGRYGSEYVFLKLISSRAITQDEVSVPVVILSKILATSSHIFEMYFCHV